jgi:integrase
MAEIDARQTSDGPRWDVRFRVNGVQRKKTFRRESDAKQYLNKVRADEISGLVMDPRGGERFFGTYATQWLDHRLVKGRLLTPYTKQGYLALLRRNINPTFEKTRLRQITPEQVRRWHSKVTAEKGSDQAAKSYRLLRAILNTAVSDELVPRNPCLIKGAGIENPAERPMLDTTTVLRLADAVEPRLRALILLGGFAGLRPGELLGLQRQDIDPLHATIRVERQLHEIVGVGRVIAPPKTEAGFRKIALPRVIAEELAEHLDTYVALDPTAPVFSRPSGLPLRRSDLSNAWKRACEAVGLVGAHPHDLRHHAATMFARKPDLTLKELMATIGHSSPRAALIYQHATEERGRELADFMDDQIAAAKASPETAVVRLRP